MARTLEDRCPRVQVAAAIALDRVHDLYLDEPDECEGLEYLRARLIVQRARGQAHVGIRTG